MTEFAETAMRKMCRKSEVRHEVAGADQQYARIPTEPRPSAGGY